jgi:hypothetical protein
LSYTIDIVLNKGDLNCQYNHKPRHVKRKDLLKVETFYKYFLILCISDNDAKPPVKLK